MNRPISKEFTAFLGDNVYDAVSSGQQLKLNDQRKEVNRLLKTQFKESDGQLCNVFAVIEDNEGVHRYSCILCLTDGMNVPNFINHAESEQHRVRVRVRVATEKSISSIFNIEQNNNGEAKSESKTQSSKVKDRAVIGMEYIIEVFIGVTFQSNFHCVLCERNLTDSQSFQNHLTSSTHRLKYLEKHFPTAFRKISAMETRGRRNSSLEKVCAHIEDQYGRLTLSVVRSDEFFIDRMKFYEEVVNGSHFDEKMGPTFAELCDENDGPLNARTDPLSSTCSSESGSTCSGCNIGPYKPVLLERSPKYKPVRWQRSRKYKPVRFERSPKYNDGNKSGKYKNPFLQSKGVWLDLPYKKKPRNFASTSNDTNRVNWSRDRSRDRSRSPQRNRRESSLDYRKSKNDDHSSLHRKSSPQFGRGGAETHSNLRNKSPKRHEAANINRQSKERYENVELCSSRAAYPSHHNGASKITSDKKLYKNYSPMQTSSDSENDEGPVTIISVLSVLSAFENLFGSLGPKMIDMMSEAIAMEKVSVNSSNSLLDNSDHCILFEVVKEKLKGIIQADLVESKKRIAIQNAIRNMEELINAAQARKTLKIPPAANHHRIGATETARHDRCAIGAKVLLTLHEQGRAVDISEAELACYVDRYIELSNAKQCHPAYDIQERKFSTAKVEKAEPEEDEKVIIDLLDTDDDDETDDPVNTAVESILKKLPAKPEKPMNNPVTSSANHFEENYSMNDSVTTAVDSILKMVPAKLEQPIIDLAMDEFPSKLDEPTTLTDSNLRTLIKNFGILSDTEKRDVIANVKELEISDPKRMKRLRMEMNIDEMLLLHDVRWNKA